MFRAAEAVERMRDAGIATSNPILSTRLERSSIRVYFAPDRAVAEAVRSRLGDTLKGLGVELTPPGPSTRPGAIDVFIGEGSDLDAPDHDTVVHARRLAGPDAR